MFVSAHFGDLTFAWLASQECVTAVYLGVMWMEVILRIERIETEFGVILGR